MIVSTSFTPKLYDQYGKRFIDSFLLNWPENAKLICYLEGYDHLPPDTDRIAFLPITTIFGWQEFQDRHRGKPVVNGYGPQFSSDYKIKYDAVRFSHKALVTIDATTHYFDNDNLGLWVGADVFTHTKIPAGFIESTCPPDCYVGYLGRKNSKTNPYPECDYLIFRTDHPCHHDFMRDFKDFYLKDSIFELPEWHDCWAFMTLLDRYVAEGKCKGNDLSSHITGTSHVFINSVLGMYMDHLKGNRKAQGRSGKWEMKVGHKSKYWQ